MFYFIIIIFFRKRKSYVKIIFCKHEWNSGATTNIYNYKYLFVITPLLIEINDLKKFVVKKCVKKYIYIRKK